MITLADYWMGRDKQYANALTADIVRNAEDLLKRVNVLLADYRFDTNDTDHLHVNSGWRPPQVNAATPNAAPRSHHMTGRAIDIADPEGALDEWCLTHPDTLRRLGLYQEHPSATKSWCHLQSVAPRSGRLVFYP